MKYLVLLIFLFINYSGITQGQVKAVFPGKSWQHQGSEKAGMNNIMLDSLVKMLEGRGCIIKNGFIVKEWGDQSETSDWMSAVKPLFSTFLFFAVEEGRISGVHYKIRKLGWNLNEKDKDMEFYHLANMISGYARPEKPGEAWAYNDYAIQLYQKSLFDSVFRQSADQVLNSRLRHLQFEDSIKFRKDKPRLFASVRDFARVGLFWLHQGNWNGEQLLPPKYFTMYMKPQVPKDLPQTKKGLVENDDYLKIGTFGGGSDHFVEYGPGIYGFNWWFNSTGRLHPQAITWPDATPGTFMAVGAGGNVMVMVPEYGLILVSAKGKWGKLVGGDKNNKFNRAVKLLLSSVESKEKSIAKQPEISLALFRDGIHHWAFMSTLANSGYERYKPSEFIGIADNLLKYQNKDGGWLKNIDWLAKLDPAKVLAAIPMEKQLRSTLDNRNTYSQVEYLSKVYAATGIERFRESAEKGIEYILKLQNKSGGWRGWDADAITYNDDVMTGVMNLFLDIVEKKEYYSWISESKRNQIKSALQRAIDVTLRAQIVVKGKKTGWCQQHDHITLLPVKARTYELPSICAPETADIIEFLMRIKDPDKRTIDAIESGVKWLDEVKILGMSSKRIPMDKKKHPEYTSGYDLVMVKDPSARPIWARYYEIEDNTPFLANRDGKKVYDLKDVAPERRTGYGWYSNAPASVIDVDYPSWKKKIAK